MIAPFRAAFNAKHTASAELFTLVIAPAVNGMSPHNPAIFVDPALDKLASTVVLPAPALPVVTDLTHHASAEDAAGDPCATAPNVFAVDPASMATDPSALAVLPLNNATEPIDPVVPALVS